MSAADTTIAGIKLRKDRPTTASFADLGEWVLWQFPRRERRGYRGAVRPASADQQWLPAIIQADRGRVQIYGHIDASYPSPETAVAYFTET
jgi:hypothetical protein